MRITLIFAALLGLGGCRSLQNFLNAWPDSVRVLPDGNGGYVVQEPIGTSITHPRAIRKE